MQALRAAAHDGVDVRLLVPGASDIPIVRPLSRAGYRPLLEAGVRVFEWNGSMLHAKTAVADGRWARVGSTNLNVASWLGNCELDVDRRGRAVRAADGGDVSSTISATRRKSCSTRATACARLVRPRGVRPLISEPAAAAAARAVAGAFRIGSTVSAAVTDRRVLEPIEAHIALIAGTALVGLVALALWFPRGLAYPVAVLAAWPAVALLARGFTLLRDRHRDRDVTK